MSARCLICLDVYCETSDIRVTACGHVFHRNCAISWLLSSGDCPECRCPIYERQLSKVFLSFTHDFEDEALRLELDTTSAALSMLKKDMIELKSSADLVQTYKLKIDMMTEHIKLIEQDLEEVQWNHSESQHEFGELKIESDKLIEKIALQSEKLDVARKEVERLEKINANQAENQKMISEICYQLVSTKQKTLSNECETPIAKELVTEILQNKDFVQEALNNKSYFEKCILNKEFCSQTFSYENDIKKYLKKKQSNSEKNSFVQMEPDLFFNNNLPNRSNSDKTFKKKEKSYYTYMNRSRYEKKPENNDTSVVKNNAIPVANNNDIVVSKNNAILVANNKDQAIANHNNALLQTTWKGAKLVTNVEDDTKSKNGQNNYARKPKRYSANRYYQKKENCNE